MIFLGRQSTNGASRERLDRLLRMDTCRCHRTDCFNHFVEIENQLMAFLETFWSMEKPAQDSFDLALVVSTLKHHILSKEYNEF